MKFKASDGETREFKVRWSNKYGPVILFGSSPYQYYFETIFDIDDGDGLCLCGSTGLSVESDVIKNAKKFMFKQLLMKVGVPE